MKLFIDTSNKKFILAIINEDNKIIDFFMRDTNNDIVKNAVYYIDKMIKKNELKLNDFNRYMLTIGPGSFTGVKVALNIIKTIDLIHPIEKVYTIETFDLIEDNRRYTAIPFGKSKFYLKDKNSFLKKIKVINDITKYNEDEINLGYDNFNRKKLKEKISSNSFKLLDNLDKVKIKYLSNF